MIMVDVIGRWAGSVWTALDHEGTLSIKQLKKVTKLKEKELYAAIGWLAREGKINITENEADVIVSLI